MFDLLNDDDLRSKMGKNGEVFVSEFYDRKGIAENLLHVIENILK